VCLANKSVEHGTSNQQLGATEQQTGQKLVPAEKEHKKRCSRTNSSSDGVLTRKSARHTSTPPCAVSRESLVKPQDTASVNKHAADPYRHKAQSTQLDTSTQSGASLSKNLMGGGTSSSSGSRSAPSKDSSGVPVHASDKSRHNMDKGTSVIPRLSAFPKKTKRLGLLETVLSDNKMSQGTASSRPSDSLSTVETFFAADEEFS